MAAPSLTRPDAPHPDAPHPPAVAVGLEHEFEVFAGGRKIDFRRVIHRAGIDGLRIDLTDGHAYRTPSGVKLTCDGPEAEYATPPVPVGAGFTDSLTAWAAEGARQLVDTSPRLRFVGASTHLSVSVPDRLAFDLCGRFAGTFAAALMMLADGADAPGLLVRPRPGRIELGFDYASGPSLRAAVAMAVGGVLVCTEGHEGEGRSDITIPPPLKVRAVPAVDRFGWFVARTAYGPDLYACGRAARLRRARRIPAAAPVTAQDHLAACWVAARRALVSAGADAADLADADALVAGARPLPGETAVERTPPHEAQAPPTDPVGAAVTARRVGDVGITPVAATWDFVVFEVEGPHQGFACVPAADLGDFLRGDRLPQLTRPPVAALADHSQTRRFGYYAEMGAGSKLTAPERDGRGVAILQPGAEAPGVESGRAGKGAGVPLPGAGGIPAWAWWAGGAFVAVVLLVTGLTVLGGGSDEPATPGTSGAAPATTSSSGARETPSTAAPFASGSGTVEYTPLANAGDGFSSGFRLERQGDTATFVQIHGPGLEQSSTGPVLAGGVVVTRDDSPAYDELYLVRSVDGRLEGVSIYGPEGSLPNLDDFDALVDALEGGVADRIIDAALAGEPPADLVELAGGDPSSTGQLLVEATFE